MTDLSSGSTATLPDRTVSAVAESTRSTGAAVLESHEVGADEPKRHPFPDRAARHWLLSSIVWLTVVDLFGLVLATEFVSPEAFGGISWLTFSRIRPSHVNGVILAWLTMMYFGALFYMLPRLRSEERRVGKECRSR